jgi:hypothetical protein
MRMRVSVAAHTVSSTAMSPLICALLRAAWNSSCCSPDYTPRPKYHHLPGQSLLDPASRELRRTMWLYKIALP